MSGRKLLFINMLILWALPFRVCSQDIPALTCNIMFYNAENAFDTFNDPVTEDDDFTPGGLMRWNQKRYGKKIDDLYKTIIAAGEWSPPDIVAFCEIENRQVLEDLVFGTYLSKFGYRIIHEESPDRRGIDVCMIYRGGRVKVDFYKYLVPVVPDSMFRSRSILYTRVLCANDTMHLFVNHWPSRKGGVLAGEDLRNILSALIRQKADSISRITKHAKIIIMGDFNSAPDDNSISSLIKGSFVNLSDGRHYHGQGTYRYMGIWEMIDQIIISESLLECSFGLYADKKSFAVFNSGFLLKEDPKYPGLTPFSTYRGYRYQGGFSDHLPVIIRLLSRQ